LEKCLDSLDKIEEDEAQNLIDRSAKYRNTIKQYIYWTGIIVFTSVVLFTIVIRSIMWPVSYLQHIMRTSANTREIIEAELPGKNELVTWPITTTSL